MISYFSSMSVVNLQFSPKYSQSCTTQSVRLLCYNLSIDIFCHTICFLTNISFFVTSAKRTCHKKDERCWRKGQCMNCWDSWALNQWRKESSVEEHLSQRNTRQRPEQARGVPRKVHNATQHFCHAMQHVIVVENYPKIARTCFKIVLVLDPLSYAYPQGM